jgi:hypothetical protein
MVDRVAHFERFRRFFGNVSRETFCSFPGFFRDFADFGLETAESVRFVAEIPTKLACSNSITDGGVLAISSANLGGTATKSAVWVILKFSGKRTRVVCPSFGVFAATAASSSFHAGGSSACPQSADVIGFGPSQLNNLASKFMD